MTTHSVKGQRQQDLESEEHCSAELDVLQAVGRELDHQVRIKRPGFWDALFTAKKERSQSTDDIVGIREDPNSDPEQGEHGLLRLGLRLLPTDCPEGTTCFEGALDSQVPHPTLDDNGAKNQGEFVERGDPDNPNSWLIAIAPHGGKIEECTDDQAERVRSQLTGRGANYWLCKGYKFKDAPDNPKPGEGGAYERWHITSTEIHEECFPQLKKFTSRTAKFKYAVAFHGFKDDDITDHIIVGGGEAVDELKERIVEAIRPVVSSKYTVRKDKPTDPFRGRDSDNVVNRLTESRANGIHIEQKTGPRTDFWQGIADAVANVFMTHDMPDTVIGSGPSGTVSDTTATFTFSSIPAGSSFECNLDGKGFEPCASPKTYTGLVEGEHAFEVRAVNADGQRDPSPAKSTWTIQRNPGDQIRDLVAHIEALNIKQGIKQSLTAKLDNALKDLEKGNTVPACNKLGAFNNEVEAQKGKELTQAQAEELLKRSNRIRAALNCS